MSWPDLRDALERGIADLIAEGHHFIMLGRDAVYSIASGCIHHRDESIPLSPRERDLLNVLAAHRHEWLSGKQLIKALYPDPDLGSEETLRNLLTQLRKKTGKDTIINRYRLGYRLRESFC